MWQDGAREGNAGNEKGHVAGMWRGRWMGCWMGCWVIAGTWPGRVGWPGDWGQGLWREHAGEHALPETVCCQKRQASHKWGMLSLFHFSSSSFLRRRRLGTDRPLKPKCPVHEKIRPRPSHFPPLSLRIWTLPLRTCKARDDPDRGPAAGSPDPSLPACSRTERSPPLPQQPCVDYWVSAGS